jgi:hypothetical protein
VLLLSQSAFTASPFLTPQTKYRNPQTVFVNINLGNHAKVSATICRTPGDRRNKNHGKTGSLPSLVQQTKHPEIYQLKIQN